MVKMSALALFLAACGGSGADRAFAEGYEAGRHARTGYCGRLPISTFEECLKDVEHGAIAYCKTVGNERCICGIATDGG